MRSLILTFLLMLASSLVNAREVRGTLRVTAHVVEQPKAKTTVYVPSNLESTVLFHEGRAKVTVEPGNIVLVVVNY